MRTPFRKSHGKITFVLYNKPFPCGGHCLYCFTSKGFTKSTTPNEDTLLAKENDWNGRIQLEKRFGLYGLTKGSGLKCDFAVKGDSFARHDADYLRTYTKELYDFLNGRPAATLQQAAEWQKKAPDRCVTYKIETRPDQIDEQMCRLFMELGITTVEIGVQSLNDHILKYNRRGHDSQLVADTTKLLRKFGFEVCYQMMVGLPGSSYEIDLEILASTLWKNEFAPDALKVYPCLLLRKEIADQEPLRKLYHTKQWSPMSLDTYLSLWRESYPHIPRYVHINRIQRIITPEKIECGITTEIDRHQFDDLSDCLWQRSPAQRFDNLDRIYSDYRLEFHSQGNERFCVDAAYGNHTSLGYGRLDFISPHTALIRDIRVLGNMLKVGEKSCHHKGSQHIGIGSAMLSAMENKALSTGKKHCFVRPSFGTVGWFEERGYRPYDNYFYVKHLSTNR